MKNIISIIFTITLFLLFISSCKPTEKGYKAAYDAALGKRQSATSHLGVEIPDGAFMQVDGPELKEFDGVKVYLLSEPIKPAEDGKILPASYNVAVGCYKMSTNCAAQTADLQKEGYENAFTAVDPEGKYYTIAYSCDTLKDAVDFYKKYQSSKNRTYVGLPGAPVIIFSSK